MQELKQQHQTLFASKKQYVADEKGEDLQSHSSGAKNPVHEHRNLHVFSRQASSPTQEEIGSMRSRICGQQYVCSWREGDIVTIQGSSTVTKFGGHAAQPGGQPSLALR